MTDAQTLEILEFPKIRQRVKEYCSFAGGAALIDALEPSGSYLVIQQELERTKDALDITVAFGPMPFLGIREIRPALALAKRGGIIGISDLQSIAQHDAGVKAVLRFMEKAGKKDGPVSDLVSSLSEVPAVSREISRCITAEGTISDHASSELGRIRRKMRESRSDLEKASRSYLATHASLLQDQITAVRGERTVVLAKAAYKNALGGIQYDQTGSGSAVYLEPAELVPYNNALQDLRQKEEREVESILRSLSALVGQHADQMAANMETLSILDALFAKAQYGKSIEGCAPQVKEGHDLELVQAWHPLLDPKKAVRNDYRLKEPHRILLITGPNTGGKTVTLKTIGLFALMAYAGIPVSADSAVIPVYDQIFADIGDTQSIAESLSTFSAHIAKLSAIFRKASVDSLILIDELAGGTDPREGENLAASVLEEFRKEGMTFIGSTHYEKLKSYAKGHPDVLIASMDFDMERLEPTYRYREGRIGTSNAFDIALRYGVPEEVIRRARKWKEEDQTESEKLLERLSEQEARNARREEELQERIRENAELSEELKAERQKLDEQKEEILEETREQAESELLARLEEADQVIRQLKEKSEYRMPEAIQAKREIRSLIQQEAGDQAPESPDDFRVGDTVRIIRTSQVGTITEISRGRVTLDMHGITVKTSAGEIRKEKSRKSQKRERKKEYEFHADSFSPEVNLIGMRAADALEVLDKYLDDAILHHCPYVRVIHGFGTGQLRKAVWDYLKRNKYVASYEFAPGSEGGAGATIVKFKG